jgi:hypothetical protein
MAKTQFHKNQHVNVKSVSTWALIERAVPHWTKDIDEPVRIHYDVGLGREFAAGELLNDRAPSTYPVVVTEEAEWCGWRVAGAECGLKPAKIEEQARLIACPPQLAGFVGALAGWARKSGEDMPDGLAHRAQHLLSDVKRTSW